MSSALPRKLGPISIEIIILGFLFLVNFFRNADCEGSINLSGSKPSGVLLNSPSVTDEYGFKDQPQESKKTTAKQASNHELHDL